MRVDENVLNACIHTDTCVRLMCRKMEDTWPQMILKFHSCYSAEINRSRRPQMDDFCLPRGSDVFHGWQCGRCDGSAALTGSATGMTKFNALLKEMFDTGPRFIKTSTILTRFTANLYI